MISQHPYPWVPSVSSKFPRLPAIDSNLSFQLLGRLRGKFVSGPVLCAWYDREGTCRALVLPTSLTRPLLTLDRDRLYGSDEVVFACHLGSTVWSTSRRWKGEPWTASMLALNNPDPLYRWTDEALFENQAYNVLPGINDLRDTTYRERARDEDRDPPSMD